MLFYLPKDIGNANVALTHTAGTINLGWCRQAIPQAILDTNSGFAVAVKGSQSAAATCSKSNCAGILLNDGAMQIDLGPGVQYLAYRVYNGATAAAGGASDKLAVQLKG